MRLLLLHALPFDGGMWAGELDLLPGRTITPTLYGLGDSVQEWGWRVADELLEGDEPTIVLGCSVGGSCALEVARAAPDKVAGLILVGAKATVRPDPIARDAAIDLLRTTPLADAFNTLWAPLFGPATDPSVLGAARRWVEANGAAAIERGVRAFHDRRDSSEFVATWPKPIAVIAGEFDTTPSHAAASAIVDRAQRTFHVVAGAGHYVSLEAPSKFRRVVVSAIDRMT